MKMPSTITDSPPSIPKPEWQTAEMMQLLVDNLVDYAIILLDPQGRVLTWNAAAERIHGWKGPEIIGQPISLFHTPEQNEHGRSPLALEIAARDGSFEEDDWRTRKDGSRYWAITLITALRDSNGSLKGFGKVTRDLTQRTVGIERIKAQAAQILEMATVPLVQVWEGIVLVPLIGTLDSLRTQQLTERLLQRITETDSPIALLDITGVPTIDTQTAQHLIEMIAAVRLLGSEVVMTGVRPIIAQTLVHLGIDLSNVTTRPALAAGLRMAMKSLDLVVVKTGEAMRNGA
jgi:PAS domain S-box-containing protein